MHFDVITLFPEMFDAITQYGVTRRAAEQGKLVLRTWNPREFTIDKHRSVSELSVINDPVRNVNICRRARLTLSNPLN